MQAMEIIMTNEERKAIVAEVVRAYDAGAYPNDLLTDICDLIVEYGGLTSAQMKNLVADLPGEYENRAEAAYDEWMDSISASWPDDATYRREMIAAGRGHLLGD